jgi:uncharacterized protein YgbK (DUF1537 family)
MGRTTVDGVLLVNGIPVAETQLANDPMSPVRESHIPTLLERSMGCQAGLVSVKQIDVGAESLYHTAAGMSQTVIVCDVVTQSHLASIAEAASLAKGRWLLCGSGGLGRELHVLLGDAPARNTPNSPTRPDGPALVAIGSRNQMSATQLLKARDGLGLPILELKTEGLNEDGGLHKEIGRITTQAHGLASQGKTLAITSTFSEYVPALKWAIAPALAEAVASLLVTGRFAGLLLSGGDIALEVCRRLSVSAIRVHGEVEPGVPAGEVLGGQFEGMRVVTKAGGFGTEAALIESIAYLEKGSMS